MQETLKDALCDFCLTPAVRWDYPCADICLELTCGDVVGYWNSQGDWAACDECHRLIEDGKWDELVNRAVTMQTLDPEERGPASAVMAVTYQAFRKHRLTTMGVLVA